MAFGKLSIDEMEELVPSAWRDLYPGDSKLVTEDGQPISQALVEFSYTRDGRHLIGTEFPNPVPVEAPISQAPYEDIWVTIRRMVLEQAARDAGGPEEFESEEEANDFEVGDDFDPSSPWEEVHEPTDPWPMSSAARQLEQAIAEKRNQGRISVLQDELDALQNGKPWPPVDPAAGGGGAQPPSDKPPSDAAKA